MKTFQEYITEQQMSVQDAQTLLGLHNSYSADDLKIAYKKMAILHHPDTGGDVALMQKVNAAYDKLSKALVGGAHQSPEDRMAAWRHGQEQDRVFLVAALGKVKQKLNAHAFVLHFKGIFGEDFSVIEKDEVEGQYSAINVEFSNHTRTTALDLHIHISARERHNTGLGTQEQSINMYVSTSILHNRRKLKLSQNNYRFEHDFAVLSNPEMLFPSKKLLTKKAAKQTKFTKKDAILSFKKELHAEFRDDWLTIPLPHSDHLSIVLYRNVYMRTAAWAFNGIYQKSRRIHEIRPITSFWETEASVGWLIEQLKKIQSLRDDKEVHQRVEHLVSEYKANREKIDPLYAK